MIKSNNNIFLYALIILASFAICCWVFTPVLNSSDDFFLLYVISGGYGDYPTCLLYYYQGWHPFLSWPVSRLFRLFPFINWYSLFLLAIHFFSCINLLYLFSLLFKKGKALLIFLLFFVFIELRLFLFLNYSNTALIAAISGLTSYIYVCSKRAENVSYRKMEVVSLTLIFISGLLRFHIFGLFAVCCLWIAFFILSFRDYTVFARNLIAAGVIVFLLFLGQRFYYQSKIPDWNTGERFRQAIFAISNHPMEAEADTGTARVRNSFIAANFFYDTSYTNYTFLYDFPYKAVKNPTLFNSSYRDGLKWVFMEVRVYLLLMLGVMLLFFSMGNKKMVWKWLLMAVIVIALFLCLSVFFKISMGVIFTLVSVLFLSAIWRIYPYQFNSRPIAVAGYAIIAISFLWMLIRVNKINNSNSKKNYETRAAISELNAHRDLLFVSSNNDFPVSGYGIWDIPNNLPVKNLLHLELISTDLYSRILRRYSINDIMQALPLNSNIVVTGNQLPDFKSYYLNGAHKNVLIAPVKGFKYLKVFRLQYSF